jgi:monoamine oxidase
MNIVRDKRKTSRVIILEARDRVGGRTLTTAVMDLAPSPGFLGSPSIDLGGQWVGPNQPRVLRLIEEFGLVLKEQVYPVKQFGSIEGLEALVECVGYDNPPLDEVAAAEFKDFISGLEPLLDQINPAAPWDHPNAEEFDNISVAEYVMRHVGTNILASSKRVYS